MDQAKYYGMTHALRVPNSPPPSTGTATPSCGEDRVRFTDFQLVERCLELPHDGMAAFREIVQKYQPGVDALCSQLLGPGARALEASERTFVEIYRKLVLFETSQHSFSEWVFRTAFGQCRTEMTKSFHRAGDRMGLLIA